MISFFEQDFYVVCVSYDGFDETEDTVFTDMITELSLSYADEWVKEIKECCF
ncbi:MAG: hypothetical protein IJ291_03790 [Lachnospiraceae bacterium]|nr:hypothetical protein [Lachnospiraceae bacterium]